MRLRSLLFVPGDRPERFAKAAASGADALILDLEDSVVPERKAAARAAVAAFIGEHNELPYLVRVNPLDSADIDLDVAAIAGRADGIVLPKAEGAASISEFFRRYGEVVGQTRLLPIATETPAAIFQLGSYASVTEHLLGLTWGAEDLPAAIGAISARLADGSYTPPIELVRSLTLFGAHAAQVQAIETVYPALDDLEGLARYVERARRDGFGGMMAIHPRQIPIINAGFTPDAQQIAHARAVIAAFAANPDAGALRLDNRMIDRPHLLQARRLLALAGEKLD
ncbi:HpcH/HpaI aldolase/citrate lyase family protein [Devosia sp. A369]